MILKILLAILLLLLNSSSALAVTQWCDDASIETCWTIETGSGTTWDDKSSNNVDATLDVGDPSFNADVPDSGDGFNGTSNYSMDFDGNDGMVSAYDVDQNTANTFVMWAVVDNYTASDRFFSYNDASGHGLLQYASKPNFWGNGFDLYASLDNIPEGEWEHYACVMDETADLARIYVNGVLKQSDTNIASQTSNTFDIGHKNNSLHSDLRFDEFAIFSVERDSTDINDIMDNGLVQAAAEGRRRIWIQ